MSYIFYLFAIIPFYSEFVGVYDPKRIADLRELSKTNKDVKSWDSESRFLAVCALFYWIWCFVGLFTFQFPAFGVILALSLIPKKYEWVIRIDAIICLITILFIVINKAHLHINLFELMVNKTNS